MYLWNVGAELAPGRIQIDLDDLDIVDFGADGVHSIRRRADENPIFPRHTRDSEEEIDHLIRSDSKEDIVGRWNVSVVADELLER